MSRLRAISICGGVIALIIASWLWLIPHRGHAHGANAAQGGDGEADAEEEPGEGDPGGAGRAPEGSGPRRYVRSGDSDSLVPSGGAARPAFGPRGAAAGGAGAGSARGGGAAEEWTAGGGSEGKPGGDRG